jgi:hypothetical protein
LGKPDVSDQLGHVHSVIGLARVEWCDERWSEACQTLEAAIILTKKYKTFSPGNYYKGIIYLFLSVVYFNFHKYPEGRLNHTLTHKILDKEKPRHFMPGMGLYF